jgi:hypothetical protein
VKLIKKFGLVALLVAFLAVPALAQDHQSKETTSPPESYKAPQEQPTPAVEVKSPRTQTGSQILPSGVKGESTPQQRQESRKLERPINEGDFDPPKKQQLKPGFGMQ